MEEFLQDTHGKMAFPLHYIENHNEYNDVFLKVYCVHTLLW